MDIDRHLLFPKIKKHIDQLGMLIPFRKGCSDAVLADVFLKAVGLKPLGHNLSGDHPVGVSAQMCAIGG